MAGPSQTSSTPLRSALAHELVRLGAAKRRRLEIPDLVIGIAEMVVLVAENYGAGPDWWPSIQPRFDEILEWHKPAEGEAAPTTEDLMPPVWVHRIDGTGWVHLQRVVGAGAAFRLKKALKTDLATLAAPLRAGLRDLLPVARAFDICMGPGSVSPGVVELGGAGAADLIMKFDNSIEQKLASFLGEDCPPGFGEISYQEIAELLPLLGAVTEDAVLALLTDIGTPLLRKLKGAREVLGASSDDISQCANSLTEFIDRLLRSAFTPDEVMAWVNEFTPGRNDRMAHESPTGIRPSKFAEALCFLHAGSPPPDDDTVAEVAASALVAARSQLQKLKHADETGPEDRTDLEHYFEIVEASFLLIFKLGWRLADEDRIESMRARLAAVA